MRRYLRLSPLSSRPMSIRLLTFFALVLLLTACGGQARPTPTLPVNDDEAIRQMLRAESAAVVQQDIDRLAELWAEDATVTDAKHTPSDASDDAVWRGIDAILDRYVVVVFPGNPQFAEPNDVQVQISGDQASATSTTRIGAEISPAGDRWTFVRRDHHWLIQSLTYNLEP